MASGARPENAISARPGSCRRDRADPPDLAGEEIGGRHGRQFRRQAEAGRQREDGEAGKAPDHALTPVDDAAGELGHGDEKKCEADAADDVDRHGIGETLEPILRRPGVVAVMV